MITDIHSEDRLVQRTFAPSSCAIDLDGKTSPGKKAISQDVIYWAQPFPFGTNGLTAF